MDIINEDFKNRLLDLSVYGVYVYDLVKGTNLYINKQYTLLTGYKIEDINQMSQEDFFALFHPQDQEAIAKHMQDVIALNLGEIIEIEYRFKNADGNWMWLLSRDAIFKVDNNNNTQFIGSFIDITERKNIEKELEISFKKLKAKNNELEQFTYIVSHDLQEPLNTINSLIQIINDEHKDVFKNNLKKSLDFISEASIRMSNLLKGLLDYSLIGTGKNLTDVNCNEIIKDIKNDFSHLINKTGTRFSVNELPTLRGYEQELKLLFQNLISNAIKFRKKGIAPYIKIEAKEEDNGVWKFKVEDNGIGISEIHKNKIFIIFQRLHNISENNSNGIGLSYCKKIVNLHNGNIWLESQVNKGSKFYFTIKT